MLRRLQFGLDRNLALLFWGIFFTQVAWGASDRFRPIYIQELGASTALVGVILGAAELFRLLGLFIAGPLSDRVSPRLLIGGGRSLIVVGAGTYLIAQEYWHLFPAFFIGALGNVAWPAISRVIANATTSATRTRSFLLIYTIGPGVASLGAPLLGGVVADVFGVRAVFAITTVGVAIAAFFFWMVRAPAPPRESATTARYTDVVRHRPTLSLCILNLSVVFFAWLGLTLAPNYLYDIHGISLRRVGEFGTLVAVGSICTGLLISRRAWLARPMNGLLATTFFLPFVFALLALGSNVWSFALAFLIWGIASVSAQTFYTAISDVAPATLQARSFALFEVMTALGYTFSGFAAGALYRFDPVYPLWGACIGSIMIIGASLAVRRYLARVASTLPSVPLPANTT